MVTRMLLVATALSALISFGPVDPDPVPTIPITAEKNDRPSEHELAVDDDLFVIFNMREALCEEARSQIDDGISMHDMLDAGVDVLTSVEDGFVVTAEGALYLRGLLVGCVSA